MPLHSFRDLTVWQKSMDLVVLTYKLSEKFPSEEKFGLTSQMRRAVVSIPSNIAEGRRRGTSKEYRQFLQISYGSGGELETQLEIALRLGYLSNSDYEKADALLHEVMRMLNALMSKISVLPKAPNNPITCPHD